MVELPGLDVEVPDPGVELPEPEPEPELEPDPEDEVLDAEPGGAVERGIEVEPLEPGAAVPE